MALVLNGLSVIDQTRKIANIAQVEGPSNLNGSQRGNYVPVIGWEIDCSIGNYFIKTVTDTGSFTFVNMPDVETYQCTIEIDHTSGAIGWPDNLFWYNNIQPPTLLTSRTHCITLIKHRSNINWVANILPNYRSYYPILDTPTNFDIPVVADAPLDSEMASAVVTVVGLEPNYPFLVIGYGGMVEAATSELTGAFATQQTVISSDTGTILLRAQIRTSAKERTETLMNVTVGKGSAQWRVTTKSVDVIPDAFTFEHTVGAEFNTTVTSKPITVVGLEPGVQFNITAVGGTVAAGTDTIPSIYGSAVDVIASPIGSIVASARTVSSPTELVTNSVSLVLSSPVALTQTATTWTVTTRARKLVPDPVSFVFPTVRGVELETPVQSSTIIVSSLEPNYQFTVSAQNGQVDGGASRISGLFEQSKLLTTSNLGTLHLALTSVSGTEPDTDNICSVTIGTVTSQWKFRTVDTIPDPTSLGLVNITGADFNRIYVSNAILVTGLEPNRYFTVTSQGGEFDAGTISLSGQYSTTRNIVSSASGTIKLIARQTTNFEENFTKTVDIAIGTATTSWSVTTRMRDVVPTPDSFVFVAKDNAEFNTEYTSDTIVVTGLEPNYNFTVSSIGGLIDVGTTTLSGLFNTTAVVTTSNQGTCVIAAQLVTGSNQLAANSMAVDIGTERTLWTVTTRAFDEVPDAFTFVDIVDGVASQEYTTETVVITGLEPNHNITVSAVYGTVDAGTYNLSGTYLQTIRTTTSGEGTVMVSARGTASALINEPTRVEINVAGGTSYWTITPTS